MTADLVPTSPDNAWSVPSETGRLTDILLCRPDNYAWIPTNDIARKTLAERGQPSSAEVTTQYPGFEAALAEAGVALHHVEVGADLPSQVCTRDSSQMTPWGVARTRLAMPQRQGEHRLIESFYSGLGVPSGATRPPSISRVATSTSSAMGCW